MRSTNAIDEESDIVAGSISSSAHGACSSVAAAVSTQEASVAAMDAGTLGLDLHGLNLCLVRCTRLVNGGIAAKIEHAGKVYTL